MSRPGVIPGSGMGARSRMLLLLLLTRVVLTTSGGMAGAMS